MKERTHDSSGGDTRVLPQNWRFISLIDVVSERVKTTCPERKAGLMSTAVPFSARTSESMTTMSMRNLSGGG
jgi:hypothetical protein